MNECKPDDDYGDDDDYDDDNVITLIKLKNRSETKVLQKKKKI